MKNKKFVCKHCGMPIRLIQGHWVHDDPDEDPKSDDYGWQKCLPYEDGSFEYAEPKKRKEKLYDPHQHN